MQEENKNFNDFFNQPKKDWDDGEKIELSEEIRQETLIGINQGAMEDALKEVAVQEDFFGQVREEDLENIRRTEEVFQQELKAAPDLPAEEEDSPLTPTEEISPKSKDVVVFSKKKIEVLKKLINNIKENSARVNELLDSGASEAGLSAIAKFADDSERAAAEEDIGVKIIEGVFNGQHMIGPDGKQYNVPTNYASKSKLVEGDILKLTINAAGKFIYKQIGPIERTRAVGKLVLNKNSEYYVEDENNRWRILGASVTYYKGNAGDEAVILIPKHGESNWAAVENIINKL